jgi:hypothetical protein
MVGPDGLTENRAKYPAERGLAGQRCYKVSRRMLLVLQIAAV